MPRFALAMTPTLAILVSLVSALRAEDRNVRPAGEAAVPATESTDLPVEEPAGATEGGSDEDGDPVAAAPAVVPSEAEIAAWIDALDADAFRDREAAKRKLLAAGPVVLEPLVTAAESGGLEVAVRSLDIFETLYARARGDEVEIAEETLDRLVATEQPGTSVRAAEIAEQYYALRERRAVAKLQELGAVVEAQESAAGRIVVPGMQLDQTPLIVRLDENWTGGDDGLRYVKRLTKLWRLYLVEGVVSAEAEEQLVADMPHLDVQGRGKAYLGIGGTPAPDGCFVQTVRPGTAAEKAGIEPGDVITRFDGKPVPGFPELIELIAARKPGDKVKAAITRNGVTPLEIEITLGRWSDDRGPNPVPEPPADRLPAIPAPPRDN